MENLFANEKLSAGQIIDWFMKVKMRSNTSTKLFPNTYLGSWEADIFEVTKSGYLYEYEVKISRADFKKDAEKHRRFYTGEKITKFEQIREGKRSNYFYYLVPENLISLEEVPEFAGLIYIRTKYTHPDFITIKQAPRLTKDKISDKRFMKLYESCYYRFHAQRTINK